MIVLGADLSYTRTGLVWLDNKCLSDKNGVTIRVDEVVNHAAIKIPAGVNRLLRAAKLFDRAVRSKKVDLCIIEDAAYAAPSRTVVCKLKELSAVFKLVLESYGVDYLEVSPTLVKKWVTGKGTAEKHVVARELKRKYGISFDDDTGHDLSDAAALAVWGVCR